MLKRTRQYFVFWVKSQKKCKTITGFHNEVFLSCYIVFVFITAVKFASTKGVIHSIAVYLVRRQQTLYIIAVCKCGPHIIL